MHKHQLKQRGGSVPGPSSPIPNLIRHRFEVKRYALSALILLLSAIFAYFLGQRLISQIFYQRAMNFMQLRYYGLAAHSLQQASAYQRKDFKIQRQWANALYRMGEISPTLKGSYDLAEQAGSRFQEAFRLNPLDARSAYGMAWQEDRLELLFTKLHPDYNANLHNAQPYYERAIRLRPNGIQYHYALAQYLDRGKKFDDLPFVVHRLARIFPPAYKYLAKKGILSPALKAACHEGLQDAIKDNILPAAAHLALADMAGEDKDWAPALTHYQQALQLQPTKITDASYLKLGHLFLKNGEMPEARAGFLKSLSLSRTRDKHLARIYLLCKNEGALNEFIDLYYDAQRQFALSGRSSILLARCFIDLKQHDEARRILEEIIADEPAAEAYYWLAQVARIEKDWDQMERAIQKATVLEPGNQRYRRIFFKLLISKNKFESAEWQLDYMIDNSEALSASLFDEKARLRWKQKDYGAALQAWQSAIRLTSDSADYYARAAEAYVMLGNWPDAAAYYQKAVKLNPQNIGYKKRYLEIMGSDIDG